MPHVFSSYVHLALLYSHCSRLLVILADYCYLQRSITGWVWCVYDGATAAKTTSKPGRPAMRSCTHAAKCTALHDAVFSPHRIQYLPYLHSIQSTRHSNNTVHDNYRHCNLCALYSQFSFYTYCHGKVLRVAVTCVCRAPGLTSSTEPCAVTRLSVVSALQRHQSPVTWWLN